MPRQDRHSSAPRARRARSPCGVGGRWRSRSSGGTSISECSPISRGMGVPFVVLVVIGVCRGRARHVGVAPHTSWLAERVKSDRAAGSRPGRVRDPPPTYDRGGPSRSRTGWCDARARSSPRKSSRRGFLVGAAVTGSAFAAAGVKFTTQPGTAYAAHHRLPSADTLCRDGYTEFCCTINAGQNSCPPGSFPADGGAPTSPASAMGPGTTSTACRTAADRCRGDGFCSGCVGVPLRGRLRHAQGLLQLLPLRPVPSGDRGQRSDRMPGRLVRAAVRFRSGVLHGQRGRQRDGRPHVAVSHRSAASAAATATVRLSSSFVERVAP